MYEALNRSTACRVESIQIGDSAFDGIQVHFIVRMTQVVPEAANRAPGNIRLVQFGERAELDCRFRYFEKAHSEGVVRHALFREHLLEARRRAPDTHGSSLRCDGYLDSVLRA
jgi:hypothetical protein